MSKRRKRRSNPLPKFLYSPWYWAGVGAFALWWKYGDKSFLTGAPKVPVNVGPPIPTGMNVPPGGGNPNLIP